VALTQALLISIIVKYNEWHIPPTSVLLAVTLCQRILKNTICEKSAIISFSKNFFSKNHVFKKKIKINNVLKRGKRKL